MDDAVGHTAESHLRILTARDVFLSHPDALWMTGDELCDLRTTSELLDMWDDQFLDRTIVRLGGSFYAATGLALSDSAPLFVLVDSWHSNNSLADALLKLDYGQWLDGFGRRWTSHELLERLTTAELATPVGDGTLTVGDDGRLVLCDWKGAPLFVHIDADDSDAFCSQLLEKMSARQEGRPSTAAEADRQPHSPPSDATTYAGGLGTLAPMCGRPLSALWTTSGEIFEGEKETLQKCGSGQGRQNAARPRHASTSLCE